MPSPMAKNAAQGIDERSEAFLHHIGVSEEAARAYDDGRGFDVDYLAFLLALNARAYAIFHNERFARGVEHESGTIAFGPLLQGTHAVHAFLLGLGVFRVGLEVAANGSMACAVIVGAKTRWDAEFLGELVDGGAGKLDSLLDGCGIRGPVSVFHDVVKGLFDAEVDARILLELRSDHEGAACDGSVSNAHILALLDDDDILPGAAGFDSSPDAGAARTHDCDIAFHGLVCGLHLGGRFVGLLVVVRGHLAWRTSSKACDPSCKSGHRSEC